MSRSRTSPAAGGQTIALTGFQNETALIGLLATGTGFLSLGMARRRQRHG